METDNIVAEEQSADQQDAFLDGWEDESDAPQTGAQADQPEEESGEEPEAQQEQEADGGAEVSDAGENGAAAQAEQPQTWKVRYMNEDRVLGAGDITPELLQKGMDYDRVRGRYDEAKPVMELFGAFAKQAGMSVEEYAAFLRTEAKKAQGMGEAEAKRAVELEDREAVIAAKENEQRAEADAKESGKARVQADLEEFAKAFPDIYDRASRDPKVIPQEVWNAVHEGLSLTAAWARHSVAQAQAEAQAARTQAKAEAKSRENAGRSTGSMQSAGNDGKSKDPFLEGWGD